MELKLQHLISNVIGIAEAQTLDPNNSVVVRISNSFTADITVLVCSKTEPVDLILPLNVTWIVTEPTSPQYKKALIRVSKNNIAGDRYEHQWRALTFYKDVMVDQYYAPDDLQDLGDTTLVTFATNTKQGIVRLSCEPVRDATTGEYDPVAVGVGDYRLSDARPPLPHTHDPIPAIEFATKDSTETIAIKKLDVSTPELVASHYGKVLRIINGSIPLRAEWVTLTRADFDALI
jgi:hypothetical protein